MQAMVLEKIHEPLQYQQVPQPVPNDHQILIKVEACGICRTDLHVVDGELPNPKLPLIPGHQIVGVVKKCGKKVQQFSIGQRLGVPWLGKTCGHCSYCMSERENLCDTALFTGYTLNGGFAEFCVADAHYCFPIPQEYSSVQAAPLLCAGLIGYRAYKKADVGLHLGIYGFGAAAHIVIQIARYFGKKVFVFTKEGDKEAQDFALTLGAHWVGSSQEKPPELLDAAIIFAPVGELVPFALAACAKGGIVVCAGIHMSEIPAFSYDILWGEKTLCSIANLTRQDGETFLALALQIGIQTQVHPYPLIKANEALEDLRMGKFTGAAVICLS